MTEALEAEFDTVAAWTADVVADLGPEVALAAACRGSGGPATLDWFLGRLQVSPADSMLDCGGGMGGPAAYALQSVGVRSVVSDLENGACRAARGLFGLTAVQADSRLPFHSGAFEVAWCLGVLCTVPDQLLLLRELGRVLGPGGRLGLLVYVAGTDHTDDQPDGNNFPTDAALGDLLRDAGLDVLVRQSIDTALPPDWQRRSTEVADEVGRRHGQDPRWELAEDQQRRMSRLLESGRIRPEAIIARVPDSVR